MSQYSLTCVNDSGLAGSFVVFQKPRSITMPGTLRSVAWFARPAHPGTTLTFNWSLDYNFVWSETGELSQRGVIFEASQVVAADPGGLNTVKLAVDEFGASFFSAPTTGGPTGRLTIQQLPNVVPDRTSIGIGMSGAATFAIQAGPNLTAIFTPAPNYWVVFGNYAAGQILDMDDVPGAQEVTYGGSLTSRTATLSQYNLITIS